MGDPERIRYDGLAYEDRMRYDRESAAKDEEVRVLRQKRMARKCEMFRSRKVWVQEMIWSSGVKFPRHFPGHHPELFHVDQLSPLSAERLLKRHVKNPPITINP